MRVTRGMFVDISLALAALTDSQPVRGGIGSVVQSDTEPGCCPLSVVCDTGMTHRRQ